MNSWGQVKRRKAPYLWTWEPYGAGVLLAVFLVVGAIQVGRAMANLCVGAGWWWPKGLRVVSSVPTVMTGDATAGIDLAQGASGPLVTAWVGVFLLITSCLVIYLVAICLRHWGPARLKGMASLTEVRQHFGVAALDEQKSYIRPDLYPRKWRG
jgi:hypothetical protein